MGYESMNLPVLTDVPVIEDRALMEYLITMKELIEEMLGRRGRQPLTPQLMVGVYEGDGTTGDRFIPVDFRPRYVKVWPVPGNSDNDWCIERIDDPDQEIDWGDFSFWHYDSAGIEHQHLESQGITLIDDDGFYVNNNGADAVPNKIGDFMNWIALG